MIQDSPVRDLPRPQDSMIHIAEGVGVPGPTEEALRWLADHGIRMAGSDTTAAPTIITALATR